MVKEKNPTVFISYSHDSKEHQDMVYGLSNKLRSEGIDCILDQYEESPPEGWPRWMQRNIKSCDFVLMVCTEIYYNRVMGLEEKGIGHGILWEGNLIYQEIYDQGTTNIRFIPIIFGNGSKTNIPDPLRGATYYNVDNQDNYEALYRRLRGIKKMKPELGQLKELKPKPRKTIFFTSLIDVSLWDSAKWKGVAYFFRYDNTEPPYLALIFNDIEKGKEIFQDWITIVGNEDIKEELRISLVEGGKTGSQSGYFVHLSQNINNSIGEIKQHFPNSNIDLIISLSRVHRMDTEDFQNLNEFKKFYKQFGQFIIAPGEIVIDPEKGRGFRLLRDFGILKRSIEFRQYKDIKDKSDPDAVLNDKFVDDNN